MNIITLIMALVLLPSPIYSLALQCSYSHFEIGGRNYLGKSVSKVALQF